MMLIVKQHHIWIKKCIQKSVKHLRWSFLSEIVSGWNPFAITAKNLPLRCLAGLQMGKTNDDADNKGHQN